MGAAGGTAAVVGLSLAQGSEFGIVLLSISERRGLITPESLSELTASIALSLVIAPFVIDLAYRLREKYPLPRTAPWIHSLALVDADRRRLQAQEDPSCELPPHHVIVAGFGVVGRAVIDSLRDAQASVAVIEMNPQTVQKQRAAGRNFVYGDVANPEVLQQAGIADASALVITVPDEQAVLAAIREAKRIRPDLAVVARTNYMSRGMLATVLGAEAVVEEIAAAREMVAAVNRALPRREQSPARPASSPPPTRSEDPIPPTPPEDL
ncbi:MAG: hypothetical protein HC927_08850 [Deltaproteobacteria bacterium]|nr:hypothetical protein [Deltaproteobacteria bacterium]